MERIMITNYKVTTNIDFWDLIIKAFNFSFVLDDLH